eukprot:3761712-Prymnesium_polylepis.1
MSCGATLLKQESKRAAPCTAGVTYGCNGTDMWVGARCRGLFRCGKKVLHCGQLVRRKRKGVKADWVVPYSGTAHCNCSVHEWATTGLPLGLPHAHVTAYRIDPALKAHGLRPTGLQNATIGMTPAEVQAFIDALMRPSVQRYLEWGSGGSTEIASWLASSAQQPRLRWIRSIESSGAWAQHMRSRTALLRDAEREGRLRLQVSEFGGNSSKILGAPDDWRSVIHFGRQGMALPYVHAGLDTSTKALDVVLIDGRFRLACAIYVLKYCHSGTKIFVHDWGLAYPTDRAQSYERMLQFYHIDSLTYTLAQLQPRARFTREALSRHPGARMQAELGLRKALTDFV